MISFFLFQSCSGTFSLNSVHDEKESIFSSYGKGCETKLLEAFSNNYYSLFKMNCASCHVNGPGTGAFASSDLYTAYESFISIGRFKVENNLLNEKHQPPYTGKQNQSIVDKSQYEFQQAEAISNICQNTSRNILLTETQSNQNIFSKANTTNPWELLSWDLENDLVNQGVKIKALFTIEVRGYILNQLLTGYEFRNPTFRLKPNAPAYKVNGINLFLNNIKLRDVNTYSFLQALVNKTSGVNVGLGLAYALVVPEGNLKNNDIFSVSFDEIIATDDVVNPPETIPGGGANPITYTQLTSAGGIFNRSCFGCHNSNNRSGGLDLSNYTAAKNLSSEIVKRTNDAINPMPKSGLLSTTDRDTIKTWVQNGTPQ